MKHKIFNTGEEHWINEKGFHRADGGPAAIATNGTEYWNENGKSHRKNKPAIITIYGNEDWYEYGNRIE